MDYEYAVIAANPPGAGSVPAAILLRAIDHDRLDARCRDDLGLVLDESYAGIVTSTVTMCVERAETIGAGAILAELEGRLSNFLTIGPRLKVGGVRDADAVLTAIAAVQFPRPA